MDKLIEAMVSVGFTAEEAAGQIKELGKIIQVKTIISLFGSEAEGKTEAEINEILDKKLEDKVNQEIVKQIVTEVGTTYVNAITKNLNQEQKDKLLAGFKEALG